jgi:hypothetical protein
VKAWLKIMCSWKFVGKKTPFFPSDFFMAWKLKDHLSYVINYPSTKELEFYIQMFGVLMQFCKLVRGQNYVNFVFLHWLLKKFHQIIILLHVFFITLFIYSLSFVFHLVCNWFMFSLCTIAFEVRWFLVVSYTIICEVDNDDLFCVNIISIGHMLFFVRGKRENLEI